MSRTYLKIGALVLWTLAAFVFGREWRDRSCDVDTANAAVTQESKRADQAEGARADDHANARSTAKVQEQRAESQANASGKFRIIERRVVEYVQANPDPRGCDLDGDGLRAWREANAGTVFAGPEPGDSGGPADR